METAFETDVNVSFQSSTSQHVASGECSFTCSLHQLPIRKRHGRNIGFDTSCDDVCISPIRVNGCNACDAGTHCHDLSRTIRPQGDCLDCHSYSIGSCRREIKAS